MTKRRMEPMVRRRRRRGSTTMGSRSGSKDSSMAEVMTLGMAMDGLRKEKYRRAALPSSKPHLTFLRMSLPTAVSVIIGLKWQSKVPTGPSSLSRMGWEVQYCGDG